MSQIKDKYLGTYMRTARLFAEHSSAKRLHVGAVIVKDDRIISIGYNGMPIGWDNDCEDKVWDAGAGGWLSPEEFDEQYPFEGWHEDAQRVVRYGLKTKPQVLHAETNAIAKLAKSSESGDGASIFITHAPCLECAKLIYQSGITQVYYDNTYKTDVGLQFLHKCGIDVERIVVGD